MQTNNYNVLFLFFKDEQRTITTFSQIAKAKPAKLFLYQDGPRNEDERKSVLHVREKVLSMIQWKCEVFTLFQEKNYGCDPSEYLAQKWAFSHVNKCIVLEDDDVPSDSFFPFCWELLEKYEKNENIGIICGMNNFVKYPKNSNEDYFFTRGGCIWGWASWKRFIDLWDPTYSWLDNKESLRKIKKHFCSNLRYKKFIKLAKSRRESGIEYYETILGVASILNDALNIVPTKNLICNIGITGGVHTQKDINLVPKKIRKFYFKETFNYNFPLKTNNKIIDDVKYYKKIQKSTKPNIIIRGYYYILKKYKKIKCR